MASTHYHVAVTYRFGRPRHTVRFAPPTRGMFRHERGYVGHTVHECQCATPSTPPAAWWAAVAA